MPFEDYLSDEFSRRLDAARVLDPTPDEEYGLEFLTFEVQCALNNLIRKIKQIEASHAHQD